MTSFEEVAAVSEAVASTSKRNDKVGAIAGLLTRLAPEEIEPAVYFLTGTTSHGRVGVGWATLSGLRSIEAAVEGASVGSEADRDLTITDVARAVDRLAAMSGPGVVAARRETLGALFAAATTSGRRLLVGILGGELRQGALDGVMTAAVAKAAGVPVADVQRAAMMAGDLAVAARAALTGGEAALAAIDLQPLRPVLPMLASPAADVAEALGDGPASVDWKLDGARIQAHRVGDEVRLFTRNLNDVSSRLPGVVALVRSLPGDQLVLDGEVLGLDADGAPRRFQDTMSGFGSELAAPAADGGGAHDGLRAFFFDVLHVGGSAVHDEPLRVRRELLAATVPEAARLPSIVTASPDEAERFLAAAIGAGHEGVMVKGLDEPYAAGRRGAAWRKVKPVYTFDLVVLAVEWGHGRRTGLLSNLHLGALAAPGSGEFVMVGKTFKGLTDELLAWQTERFLALEIGREGHVVHVRPEQVVEVAIDGVQRSSRYPGGVALRFARVRSYRHDKAASDADTIDALHRML